MPNTQIISTSHLALAVFQETIAITANQVQASVPVTVTNQPIITQAKDLVKWPQDFLINPLRSIFDTVKLEDKLPPPNENYWPLKSIANTEPPIPYPIAKCPNLATYQTELKAAIESLTSEDWQNPNLLSLFLEKYGSCLSFGTPDTALNDFARATAAVASALAQAQNDGQSIKDTQLRLIAGDLSGIQDFIYTISSDGALKSLRARSFLLELVTIEIVQQLLEKLDLPQSSVIYAGGGNIYILSAATNDGQNIIEKVRDSFNDWFIAEYQGKLFLALDSIDFPQVDIGNAEFANHWAMATQKLGKQKNRKFSPPAQLQKLLTVARSHDPCKVCHRDDQTNLQPLDHDSTVLACGTCRRMFRLGAQLFRTKLVVRSRKQGLSEKFIKIGRGHDEVYYYLQGDDRSSVEDIDRMILGAEDDPVWLINNWTVEHYRSLNTHLLLLGNYGRHGGEDHLDEDEKNQGGRFINAAELANQAAGIDRVGYLRMDVDHLGQIFAHGLGAERSLPQLTGLSRQVSYYFKVYLNSLAAQREQNSLDHFQRLTNGKRQELLFIYAGGDDLFISGAWDQVAEFACDIYQSFRAYSSNNPSITISGGISINTAKYPLYRAAAEAGAAEERAKGNDRDSLDLFGQTFKWSNWLGNSDSSTDAEYLKNEPALTNSIIKLVEKLHDPAEIGYSRAFIRNLLILADIRDQKIKDLKKDDLHRKDLFYYLHLPKLEYALSRLPARVRDGPGFATVRQSLRNPRTSPYFQAIATWVELLNRKSGANNYDRD
jgi:CRISPR-associated protein Csm1